MSNRRVSVGLQRGVQSYRGDYLDRNPDHPHAFGQPLRRMSFALQANEHRMSGWVSSRMRDIVHPIGPSRHTLNRCQGHYSISLYQEHA